MKGWIRPCWAGLRLRCPACGVGKIYAGLIRMNPQCSLCGAIFERDEGDFLGAICIGATTRILARKRFRRAAWYLWLVGGAALIAAIF